MAAQPRYHYAGTLPLTLLLCLLLSHAGSAPAVRPAVKTGLLLVWLAVLAAAYVRFGVDIDHHDLARQQTEAVLQIIRSRIAAQRLEQTFSIENRIFAGLPGAAPRAVFPGWAAVFVIYFPANTVYGRPVHFIDPNLQVNVASARGRRSAGLFVPWP